MTFQAIDTQLILDTATKSAEKAGLSLEFNRIQYKGVSTALFGDVIICPDGTSIRPQLFLRNVNDGGHALMVGVGLFRMICSNGLVVGDSFYSQRVIHRSGPTLNQFLMQLESNLDNAFQTGADSFIDEIQRLVDTKLTHEQGIQVIGSMPLPESIRESSIRQWVSPIRESEENTNVWTLYNVLNENNRRKSNSLKAFDNELGLLQNIEALLDHEIYKAA